MENNTEESKWERVKRRKKIWRYFALYPVLIIGWILLGAIGTLFIAKVGLLGAVGMSLTSTGYQEYVDEVEVNLAVCIERFKLQKEIYLEAKDYFEGQLNQSTQVANKLYEFGVVLCDEQNMSYYYTPVSGTLACYDEDMTMHYFNMTEKLPR